VIAPRPFPWKHLAPVSREHAALLQAFRRWGAAHTYLDGFAATLRDIVSAEVELLVRRVEPVADVRPLADGVGVLLSGEPTDVLLVEAEAALAAALVQCVLKRPQRVPLSSADPRSLSLAGAFAAILTAAARRGHRGDPLRVVAAASSGELATHADRRIADSCTVVLTVLLGDDAFDARVTLSRTALLRAPSPPWSRAALSSLGPVPLSLAVVAHTVRLAAADVASLRVGDALVASPWPLQRRGSALLGPVHLAAPSSTMGLSAELVEEGGLVLRGQLETLVEETEMEQADRPLRDDQADALAETIGEVPVVLRVEIGEATMTARQWATLGKGDVVSLGRRVGEHVTLRVGGVPVATGELVEVEGEVGVRIVGRTATETTRA
jgi:type III secretion system YscQ/HrcQ family protein